MNTTTKWLRSLPKIAGRLLLLSACLIWGIVACKHSSPTPDEALHFEVPSNFPKPVYRIEENPVTREGFRLGKMLFYDGILSRDGSISCAFCHQQAFAFTQHGHPLSHGIDDQLTLRNSMPIQNLAWERSFLWDGGVFHLDLFAVSPIEAPNEMDESLANVLQKLRQSPKYPALFERAFGSPEINTERFLKALAQFQLMCISANSRYDKWMRQEAGGTLTSQELAGKTIFEQKCASCHSGVLFTDGSFRNNGLPIGNTEDTGRYRITLQEQDKYTFKVPSLRNVARTAPYMHDGRIRTLEGVLNHYAGGVVASPTLDPSLSQGGRLGIALTEDEKAKLLVFLQTLTDEEFLNNPLLSEFTD